MSGSSHPAAQAAPSRRRAGGAPRLLLIGAFGMTNLGDDAILAAMLAELRAAVPGATFLVVALDVAAIPPAADVTPVPFEDRAIRAALDDTDLLIIGGGGLIFDFRHRASYDDFRGERATNFYPHYRAALIAHERGIPVFLYALGVGPLVGPVARDLTRTVGELAAAITVRDSLSKHELCALGLPAASIEVTADPSVRLPAPPAEARGDDGEKRIGFVVRDWFPIMAPGPVQLPHAGEYRGRYLDQFAAAADHAVARWGGRPVFFAVQSEVDDDREFARQVQGRMARHERATIVQAASYQELQAIIGTLDLVVSTRLHGVIFAAIAGVPAIGINLNTKIRAFLIDLGVPELASSPWHTRRSALNDPIDRVLENPAEYARRLADGMRRQRAAAARNPAICAALLAR